MKNALISVIVPVYNVEKYLERCVVSILNQTYTPFEIILINDGSTDGSAHLCNQLYSKHKEIILFHKENGGLSDARNVGIELAKGEYLTFVDSDDFLHKNYLLFLKEALDKNETKISCCSYQKYPNNYRLDNCEKLELNQINFRDSNWCINNLLINQSFTSAWGKLFQKDLFVDLKFPKGLIFEDMYVIPELLINSGHISYIDLPLYYYNQDGFSITRSSYNSKKIIDFYNAINKWHLLITNEYPRFKSQSEAKLICDYLQVYRYSLENKLDSNYEFLKNLKYEIRKCGIKNLFNKHTRFNDRIKIFLFYSGILKFTFNSYKVVK
jgi:glycosyltransferase involved in cell wall biosynthesis